MCLFAYSYFALHLHSMSPQNIKWIDLFYQGLYYKQQVCLITVIISFPISRVLFFALFSSAFVTICFLN